MLQEDTGQAGRSVSVNPPRSGSWHGTWPRGIIGGSDDAHSSAPEVAVGDSRTSYLSREPQRTSQSTPTTTRRSIRGTPQDGSLDLQRSACNQAVARLRPSRVPVPESPPSKPLDLAPRGEVASPPDADFSQVPVHTDSATTPRSAPSRFQWPISAAPSRSLSNQALPRLMAGAATPPVVIPHSHPDESAAQALAHAVMRINVPGGKRRPTERHVPTDLTPAPGCSSSPASMLT